MRSIHSSPSPAHLARLSRSQLPRPTSVRSLPARFNSTQAKGGYYPTLERQRQPGRKGIKVGYVFSGLALLGLGATGYGLWQFYSSFTAYPKELRAHLRAAIRSAQTGAYARADASFATAYEQALALSASGALGTPSAALLRTTGIIAKWGAMWESTGDFERSSQVYGLGWDEVKSCMSTALGEVGEGGTMRGVQLAMKRGDCELRRGKVGEEEAEKCYAWSVEEMMRLGMSDSQKERVLEEMASGKEEPKEKRKANEADPELDLPKWDGKVELVAGFERLGELYARQGKIDYALPLLRQAVATLLPPPPKDGSKGAPPPIPTRCHASTIMNNLSSALVSDASPSADAIKKASQWARQALLVSSQCRKEADHARNGKVVPLIEREDAECEAVAIVGAYNLGKLAELAGDVNSARKWLEKSAEQAKRIGSKEGVAQAQDAIRRLTPAQ